MAYIYKKTIHGKPYYYLRISTRINGKIAVKDIAYLGNDPAEVEQKLKETSGHEKELRKSYKNLKRFVQEEHYLAKARKLKLKETPYLEKSQLEQVEAARLHFNEHFLKMDKKTVLETYRHFLIEFAFNTTSMEGNTITLAEAGKLLEENLTPKNRTLREIYDLQNTEKVFFQILEQKKELSHEFIIKIHDTLMDNIDERKGYRRHDIKVSKSHFEASPFPYIKADIDILLQWHKKHESILHPLVLAGLFHHKLEKIHPFSDGNGRTGRMVLCAMLLSKGYPLPIIRKTRRGHYLDAMSQGDKAGLTKIEPENYKQLISFLAEELTAGYWNNFNV